MSDAKAVRILMFEDLSHCSGAGSTSQVDVMFAGRRHHVLRPIRVVCRDKQISVQSAIAEAAINFHIRNLVSKLDANDRSYLSSSIQRIWRESVGPECANRQHRDRSEE